jgi:hypothetical protein
VFLNGCVAYAFLRRLQKQNAKFFGWVKDQIPVTTACVALCGLNVEIFTLLNSKLFHRPEFSAPLIEEEIFLAQSLGLLTNVLEDFPQMVIQGIAISMYTSTNWVAVVSLSLSCIGLLYGIAGRGVAYLLSAPNSSSDEVPSNDAAVGTASGEDDTVSPFPTLQLAEDMLQPPEERRLAIERGPDNEEGAKKKVVGEQEEEVELGTMSPSPNEAVEAERTHKAGED